MGDEDSNFFFARISRLKTTMRAVGIEKTESEIVQIILRQLPGRYDLVKTITLADPRLTRPKLENTIRSVYSQCKAHEITKQWPAVGVPAEPSTPMLYLMAVACLGSSSSSSNTGLAVVACHGSSSNNNTGLATVAWRGSSSSNSNNTGLAVVACRGSSSNSSTGLATVASAAAAAATTLVSRWWHAAAAAATASMVSRQLPCFPSKPVGATAATATATVTGNSYDRR